MALIKNHSAPVVEAFPEFSILDEAVEYYHANEGNFEKQSYAVAQIAEFEGGGKMLIRLLVESPFIHKDMASYIASLLCGMDKRRAPIEAVMDLLKVKNAYIRNLGITTLQSYGDAIKYYIVKFLIGDDRDLRIFAINVLGDVNFAESREMLVELLEHEKDVNVAMTAVDYMGEIGQPADIPLLESLKGRFDDPYVIFAIDNAIRSIRG
ncbi:MAG: HEAT repeat domain-containing protein [Sulfuricurvum sp.]|jgi:HEAT repeat protein|uniref:HEAT repeat domain-containing protein n=1 Tax=Sulfuricurvum sp. TaxID=2025608 RepID=UPI0025D6B4F2|nr:HEAT repeat domain-containing protein [Sulfuricurvum sp.]MCK9371848.1 HEAT repeat domain-containing protein [Sulfuricurvum sp.]